VAEDEGAPAAGEGDPAVPRTGPRGDIRYSFDESLAGRPCTCEGGSAAEGAQVGGRATYAGVLTGRRFEQGDPPWRWLELIGRSDDDPAAEARRLVWCEESFVFVEGEEE